MNMDEIWILNMDMSMKVNIHVYMKYEILQNFWALESALRLSNIAIKVLYVFESCYVPVCFLVLQVVMIQNFVSSVWNHLKNLCISAITIKVVFLTLCGTNIFILEAFQRWFGKSRLLLNKRRSFWTFELSFLNTYVHILHGQDIFGLVIMLASMACICKWSFCRDFLLSIYAYCLYMKFDCAQTG